MPLQGSQRTQHAASHLILANAYRVGIPIWLVHLHARCRDVALLRVHDMRQSNCTVTCTVIYRTNDPQAPGGERAQEHAHAPRRRARAGAMMMIKRSDERTAGRGHARAVVVARA